MFIIIEFVDIQIEDENNFNNILIKIEIKVI